MMSKALVAHYLTARLKFVSLSTRKERRSWCPAASPNKEALAGVAVWALVI